MYVSAQGTGLLWELDEVACGAQSQAQGKPIPYVNISDVVLSLLPPHRFPKRKSSLTVVKCDTKPACQIALVKSVKVHLKNIQNTLFLYPSKYYLGRFSEILKNFATLTENMNDPSLSFIFKKGNL